MARLKFMKLIYFLDQSARRALRIYCYFEENKLGFMKFVKKTNHPTPTPTPPAICEFSLSQNTVF